MKTFRLRGLAEGIAGVSSVSAKDIADVFRMYPQLNSVRSKLRIDGMTISGFSPCDG